MKQQLQRIKEIVEQYQIPNDVKDQLDRLATAVSTEYQTINTKLNLTTKQSISRKQKIAQLYGKLDQLQTYKTQLDLVQQQNNKLSKYRQEAVKQKKITNDKIKQLFNNKLSNQNSRDYRKYKILSSQFDFENQDQSVYDRNKKNYDLLQLAETFGNDSISKMVDLPKSYSERKQNQTVKK